MRYALLAAWAREMAGFQAQLQEVFLAADTLTLQLKGGNCLKIVLNARDSFIYLENSCRPGALDTELWQILKLCRIELLGVDAQDRIVRWELSKRDIYGDLEHYSLICELMPPKPNVILCRADGMKVIDAIHKYSLSENPMRMVLANQSYFPPETSFVPQPEPDLALPTVNGQTPESFNQYFALYHRQVLQKAQDDATQTKQLKRLEQEEKKLQKRLKMQMQDLANAERIDYYQACAEAIKPNMQLIKKGDTVLKVTNYLSAEMEEIQVPLLADKSPQQNLAFYIKKYRKAKSGLKIIQLNIQRTNLEIAAIKQLKKRMESGEIMDLDEGQDLGAISGKLREQQRILNYRIDEGWQIFIGRKAKENDFLSTKLGKPRDWWFHSRIYRGAHVLLRNYKNKEPGPELIEICSSLAAWYSQARFSVNVPVDYTQIRYVRKPKGSAPGFVTYTNYRTCFANPRDLRSVRNEFDATIKA